MEMILSLPRVLGRIIILFFPLEDLKQSYEALSYPHPLYLSLRTHINPAILTLLLISLAV